MSHSSTVTSLVGCSAAVITPTSAPDPRKVRAPGTGSDKTLPKRREETLPPWGAVQGTRRDCLLHSFKSPKLSISTPSTRKQPGPCCMDSPTHRSLVAWLWLVPPTMTASSSSRLCSPAHSTQLHRHRHRLCGQAMGMLTTMLRCWHQPSRQLARVRYPSQGHTHMRTSKGMHTFTHTRKRALPK